MSSTQTYAQLLADRGVSLEQLGLRDRALHRADALAAVALRRQEGAPIFGGDVYLLRGDRVEVAYENWSTDQTADESNGAYVARSCEESRQYIEQFPQQADETPVFVLVP